MTFRVWAPHAETVELSEEHGVRPLVRGTDGAWTADVAPEGRYLLVVDGFVMPDPGATAQPDGVDGASERVDHTTFAWTDAAWHNAPWGTQVIYELHVGTFTPAGTFDAAIEKLDHLVALGIDAIELMPVHTFPGRRGWGYDPVQLSAPLAAYGGPDGLKRLVDAAHAHGIAVILDVVYNHTGPHGNHLARLGPYFTDAHRTPWGPAVNLEEAGSDEVRARLLDDARQWILDHHVDGLRVDAVHAFVDRTAVPFLEELCHEVHRAGVRAKRWTWVIAESDLNDPRVVSSPAFGGHGFDAAWNDDFHHAIHALLTGERDGYYVDFGALSHLTTALESVYVHRGTWSHHRGRRHGREVVGIEPTAFVGYAQTHDQIGNRARGERLTTLTSPARAEIAAALVLLGPFTPMLFQGEEWGTRRPFLYFTDHPDPDLAARVREGRRGEFAAFGRDPDDVPDPQDPDTHARSVLDWAELDEPEHRARLDWHRALLAARRRAQDAGRLRRAGVRTDAAAGWLLLDMTAYVVVVNLGPQEVTVPLPDDARLALALTNGDARVAGHTPALVLAPETVAVLHRG